YAQEAYKENKFAFVADVCRLYVLKNRGGIYMDTDIEFIKPLEDGMLDDVAFTGFEDRLVSAGIMGSEKNGAWINDLLEYYNGISFYLPDGELNINPITETITKIMKEKKQLINDNTLQRLPNYCTIYPSDYFYPKSWMTLKTTITPNTLCIHHFAASWLHKEPNLMGKLANLVFGKRVANSLSKKYRDIKSKK
ncbi:MAG: glycosyl transferase, partial [Pedobacter sp.]